MKRCLPRVRTFMEPSSRTRRRRILHRRVWRKGGGEVEGRWRGTEGEEQQGTRRVEGTPWGRAEGPKGGAGDAEDERHGSAVKSFLAVPCDASPHIPCLPPWLPMQCLCASSPLFLYSTAWIIPLAPCSEHHAPLFSSSSLHSIQTFESPPLLRPLPLLLCQWMTRGCQSHSEQC